MRKPNRARTQGDLFSSQFEDDFLLRTLGDLVRVPDTSLGELVANAWDAGASHVKVTIPERLGEVLSVEDDGIGLTKGQFEERWMRLAYNRQRHQGSDVEFPPGRSGRRKAYGRNGQGRHGLLCFADEYEVETARDGVLTSFRVRTTSGQDPFESRVITQQKSALHGTRLSVRIQRHRPDPDRIRDVLSSKFLFDPEFRIFVNGTSLELTEIPGIESERLALIDPDSGRSITLHVYIVQGDAGRTKRQSGVAFWVGGRLVGEPGWNVLGNPVVDGRTRPGRRTTIVVTSEDLYDEVLPDWTGFRNTNLTRIVGAAVVEAVEKLLARIYAQRIDETTRDALSEHAGELDALDPGEAREVAAVAHAITTRHPLIAGQVLSAAVEGIIEAKKESSVQALIQRVQALPEEDQIGLSRLLDDWSVRDALTVLDEIKRRIRVVEALEKLMSDKSVDELRVLHPLVAQARWLFGPEYDSPYYSSNLGLRNAMEKIFGVQTEPSDFKNSRKRPDLLVRPTSSVVAVTSEELEPETNIASMRRILLIELKKGGFRIGRDEMNQAAGYVEDLISCGHLVGLPYIQAFVIGHELDPKTTLTRTIGDARGKIEASTYAALVATANARLFRIRDNVSDRYPESSGDVLSFLKERRSEAEQMGIQFDSPIVGSDDATETQSETKVNASLVVDLLLNTEIA